MSELLTRNNINWLTVPVRLDRTKFRFTEVHFLDVGQGNMTVVIFPNDFVMVYDCNITTENAASVLTHLYHILPPNHRWINTFINSHRDADHITGIEILHACFPIYEIIDAGVAGNATDSAQYQKYMQIRRSVQCTEVQGHKLVGDDNFYVLIMGGCIDGEDDCNRQSLVVKINHYGSSVLLTGDTDSKVWRDFLVPRYGGVLQSHVLLASHHGSYSFFELNDYYYYKGHMDVIRPEMTVISVGKDNQHEHPDNEALLYYAQHSTGGRFGHRIFRTDFHKNIALELRGSGQWFMRTHEIPSGLLGAGTGR
ncbi:MAG: hypothetical protein WC353_03035 [Candidatus Peribacter sp.]|jgi:beta-lactamase superfamily II metal-dependent hydrolase